MVAHVETPLNEMFGFSTELRSLTQGKGEFSMEYVKHLPATADVQQQLIREYAKKFEKTSGKKK
jgi:elongation factor G